MLSELVIATYNKPAYLAIALDALAGQAVLPDTVCIADDGSDERTAIVLEGFRGRYPVWHLFIGSQA